MPSKRFTEYNNQLYVIDPTLDYHFEEFERRVPEHFANGGIAHFENGGLGVPLASREQAAQLWLYNIQFKICKTILADHSVDALTPPPSLAVSGNKEIFF